MKFYNKLWLNIIILTKKNMFDKYYPLFLLFPSILVLQKYSHRSKRQSKQNGIKHCKNSWFLNSIIKGIKHWLISFSARENNGFQITMAY